MRLKNYIADCAALLEQAISIITLIDDDIYTALTPISPRGSVGGHLRHIVNFYQSFLAGCEQGRIDYNQRTRDREFEQDRLYAMNSIQKVVVQLESLSQLELHDHLLVSVEDYAVWSRSSVLRELDFLRSHTVHHYSLIAMLLRLHEIDPGAEFGVAPSTLRHWEEETLCAQ